MTQDNPQIPSTDWKPPTRLTYRLVSILNRGCGKLSRYNIFWFHRPVMWINHFEWWLREGRAIRRSKEIPF
jgi:hypothetical protein